MTADPRRVKELFVAALDLPDPLARRAFLDRECGRDHALRQRLDVLLQAHDDPASVLNRPLAEVAPEDPGATVAAGALPPAEVVAEEQSGTVLAGRYKLLEAIGEGGMGTVWMAQQSEPVKRLVAVKLIKAGMDSKQVLARFEAERQALALMDHPNIAKVFDAGATPDGRPFFVMELVKGVPIARYCDEHRLTPRQRLELFVPVCQAIQHAHQKGIIHRDVKPSNVLVALYDDRAVPKVIDFGIAKATGQQLTEHTLHTGFGTVVGTLEYMSPEQAGFNQLDIDTRSDVYSLGVLLYELLAGSPPFSRKELEKAGMLEMLRVIREQEPSKPSTKLSTADSLPALAANRGTEPKRLAAVVRGELDWIVMKSLEKDRSRRYETANGFAMDIQRYLAEEPVQASPPSATYRLRKFLRRNRGAVLAALGLVGMLLVTLAMATYSNAQITKALADRTSAYHQLEVEQQNTAEALQRETGLKNQVEAEQRNTAEALRRETAAKDQETVLKDKATEALDRERLALYSYRIALAQREWEAGRVGRAEFLLDECPAPQRAWEWHYLKRQCHLDLRTLRGLGIFPFAVEWVGAGKLVVSHNPESLTLWNAEDGRKTIRREVKPIPGAQIPLSKNGQSAEVDGETILIRDLASGKEVRRIQIGESKVPPRVDFSPDGKRLVASVYSKRTEQKEIQVWAVATGQELCRVRPNQHNQPLCAFGAGGQELVHSDWEDIVVRDATTGEEKVRSACPRVGLLAASETGHRVVTWDGEVRLKGWDSREAKLLWEQSVGGGLQAMVFHPGGLFLATAHNDQTIKVWNTQTGEYWLTIRGHTNAVRCLAFRADGNRLASGAQDSTVKIWDTTSLAERMPPGTLVYQHQAPNTVGVHVSTGVSLSRDGKRLARTAIAGGLPGANSAGIVVWDTETRQCVGTRSAGGRPAMARRVALSPDGQRFASPHLTSPGKDFTVEICDAQTGQVVVVCRGHRGMVRDLAYSPDGRLLATSSDDGTVKLWDAASGQETKTLSGEEFIYRLAFSPNSQFLALDSTPWDVNAGKMVWRWNAGGYATFSRDSRRLASTRGQRIVIRDARTGAEQLTLEGHGSDVIAIAFHPDGRRLAAQTRAGSLVIWDLDTGREALTLPGSPIQETDIVFSPDGRWLYRGMDKGAVEALDATPWVEPKTDP